MATPSVTRRASEPSEPALWSTGEMAVTRGGSGSGDPADAASAPADRLRPSGTGAAAELVAIAESALGAPLPVRVRAWDGSSAGADTAPDVPTVVLRSRAALRHLLWSPGELGFARAYVTGALDVEGDLTEALRRVGRALRDRHREPADQAGSHRAWRDTVRRPLAAAPKITALAGAVPALIIGRLHRRRPRCSIARSRANWHRPGHCRSPTARSR